MRSPIGPAVAGVVAPLSAFDSWLREAEVCFQGYSRRLAMGSRISAMTPQGRPMPHLARPWLGLRRDPRISQVAPGTSCATYAA